MKEMYMEDVSKISMDTIDFINSKIDKFDLNLKKEEIVDIIENKLFDEVFKYLEMICPNDYKHQH